MAVFVFERIATCVQNIFDPVPYFVCLILFPLTYGVALSAVKYFVKQEV
jgi:hypothetical protein